MDEQKGTYRKGDTVRAYHSPSGSIVVGQVTDTNASGDLRVVPEGLLEEVILRTGRWVIFTVQKAASSKVGDDA